MALAFGVVWLLLRDADSMRTVHLLTGYRADDTDWMTVIRLPLSAFAPTQQLPPWVDALQLFAALALGSAVLGWPVAALVGMTAHIVASIAIRALLELPTDVPGHLAPLQRSALDTGPSVVFVAVVVCALLVDDAVLCAVLFVLASAVVGALTADLAGIEHAIGLVVGGLAAVAIRRHEIVRT